MESSEYPRAKQIPSMMGREVLGMQTTEDQAAQDTAVTIDPASVEMFFAVLKQAGQPPRLLRHSQITPFLAIVSNEAGDIDLGWEFDESDPKALEFARMCLLSLAKQMELRDLFSAFDEIDERINAVQDALAKTADENRKVVEEKLSGIAETVLGELRRISELAPSDEKDKAKDAGEPDD